MTLLKHTKRSATAAQVLILSTNAS